MVENKPRAPFVGGVKIDFSAQQTCDNATYMQSKACAALFGIRHIETFEYVLGIFFFDTFTGIRDRKSHLFGHHFVRQDDAAAIRVFTCVGEIVDQNLLEALGICMQDKMMIGCRDKSQLYPIVLSASDTLHDCSTYVVYVYICDIKPISARLIIGQLDNIVDQRYQQIAINSNHIDKFLFLLCGKFASHFAIKQIIKSGYGIERCPDFMIHILKKHTFNIISKFSFLFYSLKKLKLHIILNRIKVKKNDDGKNRYQEKPQSPDILTFRKRNRLNALRVLQLFVFQHTILLIDGFGLCFQLVH